MNKTLQVLIVDDDLNMTTTLMDILTSSGYVVEIASQAEEALQKLDGKDFGCIISDIRMAGMNGVEFHQAVLTSHGKIPFFFITAYAENELYEKARQQGVMGFLEKPIDLPFLLSALKSLSSQPGTADGARRRFPSW